MVEPPEFERRAEAQAADARPLDRALDPAHATLADLTRELVLVCPLVWRLDFPELPDPLELYSARVPEPALRPVYLELPLPLFEGLPIPASRRSWLGRLALVRRDAWPPLANVLANQVVEGAAGFYARSHLQAVSIVDLLAIYRASGPIATPPRVWITFMTVESTEAIYSVRPRIPFGARLTSGPPTPQFLAEAACLRSGRAPESVF